jgi:hypothetical protein
MSVEHSISIEGYPLTALAKRVDRSWGHAIEVSVVEANGSMRGKLVFACHPEFLGFDEFQAMPTEALVEVVRERLPAAIAESLSAFDGGITTLLSPSTVIRPLRFRRNQATPGLPAAAAFSA